LPFANTLADEVRLSRPGWPKGAASISAIGPLATTGCYSKD
jgi:hypothetical protein